jgi:hypothetical protein
MYLNLENVHPDLQEHVQAIHDAVAAIIGADTLPIDVRHIALGEGENLFDEAFETLQEKRDDAESDEDLDDLESEDSDLEGDDEDFDE